MSKRILTKAIIYGYHGQANFGDDIFLQVLLNHLLEKNSYSKIIIKSGNNEIPLEHKSNIEKIKSPKYIKRLLWVKLSLEMITADQFFFCAGSIFKSQSFFGVLLALIIAKVFSLGHIKVYAIGVSVGPINSWIDKLNMRIASKMMNIIAIRDYVSLNYIETKRTTFIGDIAIPYFMKLACKLRNQAQTKDSLGICISSSLIDDALCLDSLLLEISNISKNRKINKIKLIVACTDNIDGDQYASKLFIKSIENLNFKIREIIHEPINPEYLFTELLDCAYLVSCRMHVTLAGLSLGIPTIQYTYADKISDMFPTLGIPEYVYPPSNKFHEEVAVFFRNNEYKYDSALKNPLVSKIIKAQEDFWLKLK